SLRDETSATRGTRILAKDMVQIRSALAATQAMQLRQLPAPLGVGKQQYIGGVGTLPINTQGGYGIKSVGGTPQLCITEVYVRWDNKPPKPSGVGGEINDSLYMAVELYNPFSVPVTIDQNWRIVAGSRQAGAPTKVVKDIVTFPAGGFTVDPEHYA